MGELRALHAWCYNQHVTALFQAFMLHRTEQWRGMPPETVREFLKAVPESAHALPYHVSRAL